MHRLALLRGMICAILGALAILPAAAEPTRVAVFEFELIDMSLGGAIAQSTNEEIQRLALLGPQLRTAFERDRAYQVVDIAPVAARAKARNLQGCGGCDRSFAREVGADWSVTGTVHKVSNLILNIQIHVRDVDSGDMIREWNADIRGNTDQSWQRGLDWLIRNRLKLGD